MPRKPRRKKETTQVVVNGTPVKIILHPPNGRRTSWFAYRNGLVASKSTGQSKLEDAVRVAQRMVAGGGSQPVLADAVLSDGEFEAIQRVHFGRKQDPKAQARAAKSLTVCLEAIKAFKCILGPQQITLADADACAAFQRKALTMPKNWRQQFPRSKSPDAVDRISPNTVLKWSRSLQAAFERVNRNAGKKCVRGVVDVPKLLTVNPWNQFDWIEGRERPLRQFDAEELSSLLDYFEMRWAAMTVAVSLTKVFLWSSCRQQEVTSLKWSFLKRIGSEVHFEIVGKWGVERWVRIPFGLFADLEAMRTSSDYVFAAYNGQLRLHHERQDRKDNVRRVGPVFKPVSLGDWFADRIDDWSASLPKGHAYTHVFRKTSLQYVRSGEDLIRQVAQDAKVSESVMMTSYVKETDEQLRQASNRTFARLLASLPAELACRYGHVQPNGNAETKLRQAIEAKDWVVAGELTAQLARQDPKAS